jgi:hypothetical protein
MIFIKGLNAKIKPVDDFYLEVINKKTIEKVIINELAKLWI